MSARDGPLRDVEVVAPLAYQGKRGCHSVICTRLNPNDKSCIGWHCAYCDEPCGSQGHNCETSQTLIAEAKKMLDIQSKEDLMLDDDPSIADYVFAKLNAIDPDLVAAWIAEFDERFGT